MKMNYSHRCPRVIEYGSVATFEHMVSGASVDGKTLRKASTSRGTIFLLQLFLGAHFIQGLVRILPVLGKTTRGLIEVETLSCVLSLLYFVCPFFLLLFSVLLFVHLPLLR